MIKINILKHIYQFLVSCPFCNAMLMRPAHVFRAADRF
uniref:Uncharacterized protein n=1 Tax=Arundo donax TaxID=35708 RepID=A0A0A8YBZ1_ARUDO